MRFVNPHSQAAPETGPVRIMKNKKQRIDSLTIDFLKSRLDINTDFKGLYVFETDAQEMDTSFISPYRADHNSIHLITAGEVNVKINLLEYTLRKNDLVLFTTNTIRHFGTVSPDCTATNLLFSTDYLLSSAIPTKTAEAYDYLTGIINPVVALREPQVEIFLTHFSALALKMKDAKTNRFYAEDILRHLFSAVIFEIGALYQSDTEPYIVSSSRKEYVVHQFLKLVMKNFKEEKSVQAYADMLNITPKYLSTATRGLTGKTAGDLIDEMIILEAKVLLNESTMPIAHIAETLRFSDQFVFSKFFKKHCGQNPSSYRRTA